MSQWNWILLFATAAQVVSKICLDLRAVLSELFPKDLVLFELNKKKILFYDL